MWLVFLSHPNIMTETQKVKERGIVEVKCEVGEKTWGYRATKFDMMMIMKDSIIISSTPFSVLCRANLTSFLNEATTFPKNFLWGELTCQICILMNPTKKIKINHEKEKTEELGSNTEKRLVIMKRIYFFLDMFVYMIFFEY
jgi:hypothetical protein